MREVSRLRTPSPDDGGAARRHDCHRSSDPSERDQEAVPKRLRAIGRGVRRSRVRKPPFAFPFAKSAERSLRADAAGPRRRPSRASPGSRRAKRTAAASFPAGIRIVVATTSARREHPLNLSISLSGGKETNRDSLSSCERTGNSPAPNPSCQCTPGNVALGRARSTARTKASPSPS